MYHKKLTTGINCGKKLQQAVWIFFGHFHDISGYSTILYQQYNLFETPLIDLSFKGQLRKTISGTSTCL